MENECEKKEICVCVPLEVFRNIYVALTDAEARLTSGTLQFEYLLRWMENNRTSAITGISEMR